MAKLSKNLKAAHEKIDAEKLYTTAEAVKLMKDVSKMKFDATAELHVRLGIDPRHADQQIRSTVSLPHGTGRSVRVIAFCGEDLAKEAKAAGADQAGGNDLIDKVSKGWMDFDVAVSTPDMMKELAKIARVLGPKGMMPSPKAGTVGPDLTKMITEVKGGRLEFKNDKYGIIHTVFGKLSFDDKKLVENLEAMMKALKDAKPTGQKGLYFLGASISSTMSPGIKIEIESN